MPRTLFDQVLMTHTPRRTPGWMKLGSLVVHLAVVLLLMVLPITAAFDLPGVHTTLPAVMLARVSAPPPEVQPPSPPSTHPSTAPSVPLSPPEGIQPEVERPALVVSLGTPGGLGDGVPSLGAAEVGATPLPPPPVPQLDSPRRVGGNIRPPERTLFKAPAYPPAAQAARIEGIVVLEAVIDAQGVVQNVTVLRSIPLLDRAAVEAVQAWRYTPTRLNGVAIPIMMTVSVRFSLK